MSGTLAIHVVRAEIVHADHDNNSQYSIGIKLVGEERKTKLQKSLQPEFDHTLNFDIKNFDADEKIHLDVLYGKKHNIVTSGTMRLSELAQGSETTHKIMTFHNGTKVFLEGKWTTKTTTQKVAGEGAANAVETAAAVVTVNPQRALALHETHRPWFMRVSYYYDTTKNVYNYTTSFRVIAGLARFGENSANYVLEKVTGKKLADVDQQLLAPTLNTLDNKVDETITTVLVKLVEGQNYVLQKKNEVVGTAAVVAKKSTEQISSVVGSTVSTVSKAKDYTTTQIKTVSHSAYETVVSAKDYTTSQVVNVSSSAYGTVRAGTVYVVSHLPYLGAKIRA
ncbi:hypothetical protein P43SY_008726 [Pythium insidiosum]|uniref:C2 domain-containing protein n=1 Tax=Pythium insidiosum TaxID=114742 RepID=A0AAD5LUD4_PYTIN|nr:hypothetical protein P43SY_008726 [Pythium insidiosum]